MTGHVRDARRDRATRSELIDPVGACERVDRKDEGEKTEPEMLGLLAVPSEKEEMSQENDSEERREDEQRNFVQEAIGPIRARAVRQRRVHAERQPRAHRR